MITPKTAVIFIIVALVAGLGMYIMYPTPQEYKTEYKQTTDIPESKTFPPGAVMEDGTISSTSDATE